MVGPAEGCCDWTAMVIAQEVARPQVESPQAVSALSTMDGQQGVVMTILISYQQEEAPIR